MNKSQLKKLIRECIKEVTQQSLGIVEYPEAIVKQHNLDGQSMWFVYSSTDSNALILGYGKSTGDAINNAKTAAGYIKHGGTGHTGELKQETGME
jgi:hypothetical protein